MFSRAVLDNCGVDDAECGTLLRGFEQMHEFKSLVYRHNVFAGEALRALKPLLYKRRPHHLEQLRIENCRIDGGTTKALLEMLNDISYLKQLAIVGGGIKQDNLGLLCDFITSSSTLVELDMSFNKLRPDGLNQLMRVIVNNKKLMFLNLSFNQMNAKTTGGSKGARESTAEGRKDDRGQSLPENKLAETTDKDRTDVFTDVLAPSALELVENLSVFLKHNPVLIHVDVSNTGLSEKQLWYFGKVMRRSRSLRALHLCGNPGITKRLVDYLHGRARCIKDCGVVHFIDFSRLPSEQRRNPDQASHG